MEPSTLAVITRQLFQVHDPLNPLIPCVQLLFFADAVARVRRK